MADRGSSELTAHLNVWLREDEYADIKEQADIASLSISEFARQRILGKNIAVKPEIRILGKLTRLHSTLQFGLKNKGAHSIEVARAIQAITQYARKLIARDGDVR